MTKILIVEDSKVAQQRLKDDLEKLDFKIIGILAKGERAIKFVQKRKPDLIIMDIILAGKLDGLATAKEITADFDIPIIYLTERNDEYLELPSASVYLAKPFTKIELKNNINIVLEKHEIESNLRENQQFLENVFNSIKAGITVLDTKLNIVRTNPWIRGLYDADGSLKGEKCYQVYNHRNKPCDDCPVINTLKTGESHSGEIITEDGKCIELFAYPLKNEAGELQGVIEYANDITERKEIETELSHVNDIIESSPAVVFKWKNEVNWKVEFVSQNIEQFGYSKEDFLTGELDFSDIVYEADLAEVEQEVQDNLEQGINKFKQQYRIVKADGEVRWIDDWTIIIRDETGTATHFHGIIIDITDRKKAEQKIRDNERRWKFALESSQYGIWDWNLKTDEVYYSPIWKEMLGYQADELSADVQEWLTRVHPDDLDQAKKDVQQHLAGATEYYHNEHRMKHKNGDYIWVKDRGKVVEWDQAGEPLRFIGTHEDITEKKAMEKKLKLREERLNLAMDAAEHGFWDWDLDNDEIYFSPRYYTMLGYEPNELEMNFETWLDLLHPRDKKNIVPKLKDKIKQGIPFEQEFRLKTKAGAWKWILGRGKSFELDQRGKPHRAVGTHTDITERKKIEEKLKESERRYRGLVESQKDLIFRVDTNNKFTYVNDVYCEAFGKSKEELIGNYFTPLAQGDNIEEILEAMKDLKEEPYRTYNEQRAKTVNGWRWIAWENYAIRNEEGAITEIQSVGRDITELKEAQQKAETANRAKSEFLANMSHEIRTPLSAVIGFSELLENMTEDERQLSYLDSIKTAGDALLTLINDILDLSKIEAGQLDINYQKFNLRDLLLEIKQIFIKKARGKDLDFEIKLPAKAINIKLDETRLRQILLNLVGNAVKFTKQGYVRLEANYDLQAEQQLGLQLTVVDSGIGIAEKEQKNIFKAFKQQDGQSTREYGGTGLGLAITKRLTEMMDGDLTLESEEGTGSTFTIEFSDVEYSREEQGKKDEEFIKVKFAGGNILVVDDTKSNRNLFAALLDDFNVDVSLVDNGEKAIELAALKDFDLILMDIKMPKIDGYQTLKVIRTKALNQNTPVVAVTADVTTTEKEKVEEAGFADFVAKPVNKNRLLKVLTTYLGHEKIKEDNLESKPTVEDVIKINGDLSKLIAELEQEYLPQYQEINDTFVINEVEEFANDLYQLGEQYSVNYLLDYADKLKSYAASFNLKKAKQEFNNFEEIISNLKADLK
ncbi:MAG: PAS domain-containing protein [Bacillota bacterium]